MRSVYIHKIEIIYIFELGLNYEYTCTFGSENSLYGFQTDSRNKMKAHLVSKLQCNRGMLLDIGDSASTSLQCVVDKKYKFALQNIAKLLLHTTTHSKLAKLPTSSAITSQTASICSLSNP